MESLSPAPGTPISGLTLQAKWTFRSCSSAEVDRVRKKLFKFEPVAVAADDGAQWSSSSEYFSQSANEDSYLSGDSHTNLFSGNSPILAEVKFAPSNASITISALQLGNYCKSRHRMSPQ
jgi:hypothetical protein